MRFIEATISNIDCTEDVSGVYKIYVSDPFSGGYTQFTDAEHYSSATGYDGCIIQDIVRTEGAIECTCNSMPIGSRIVFKGLIDEEVYQAGGINEYSVFLPNDVTYDATSTIILDIYE